MNKESAFLLVMTCVLAVILTLVSTTSYTARLYPDAMVVSGFDFESDSVILTDVSGVQWLYRGIDDWMVGDCAACLMDSNGTEDIYDDLIVTARYAG